MAIKVKFFAHLREQVGKGETTVPFEPGLTVDQVWSAAAGDVHRPESVLMALNMEYAKDLDRLRDGDEVAFFPPVTGGQACV